jgi:hypothetical protein
MRPTATRGPLSSRDSALIRNVRTLETISPSQADALAVLVQAALDSYEEHQAARAAAGRPHLVRRGSGPRRA